MPTPMSLAKAVPATFSRPPLAPAAAAALAATVPPPPIAQAQHAPTHHTAGLVCVEITAPASLAAAASYSLAAPAPAPAPAAPPTGAVTARAQAPTAPAFSCHYCRQKRPDIVQCPQHAEGHRWCGSCVRNHLNLKIEDIKADVPAAWPDGCPRCTKTCTCSHCRVRLTSKRKGEGEGAEAGAGSAVLAQHAASQDAHAAAAREGGGSSRGTSCHYCRQKKSLFVQCDKSSFHRWCASCVKNGFGLDFEALITDQTSVWPEGCPICAASCGCSLCKKRAAAAILRNEAQAAKNLLAVAEGEKPKKKRKKAARRAKKGGAVVRPGEASPFQVLFQVASAEMGPQAAPMRAPSPFKLGDVAESTMASKIFKMHVEDASTAEGVAPVRRASGFCGGGSGKATEEELERQALHFLSMGRILNPMATLELEVPVREPAPASPLQTAPPPLASPTDSNASDSPVFSPSVGPADPNQEPPVIEMLPSSPKGKAKSHRLSGRTSPPNCARGLSILALDGVAARAGIEIPPPASGLVHSESASMLLSLIGGDA